MAGKNTAVFGIYHDRIGMTAPPDAPPPIARHRTLTPLVSHVLA